MGLLSYRGHENVADRFHRIPLRHAAGQCDLEHGVTLQDLFDPIKHHLELPVTQEPGLHLRQRLLILLNQKQVWIVSHPRWQENYSHFRTNHVTFNVSMQSQELHFPENFSHLYTLGHKLYTYGTHPTKLCADGEGGGEACRRCWVPPESSAERPRSSSHSRQWNPGCTSSQPVRKGEQDGRQLLQDAHRSTVLPG